MEKKIGFRLAAKAFIVDKGKLLIVKRRRDDVQKPWLWEIPGGRLELGENPFAGLQREVKEETGLAVKVGEPLSVRHFTRDDGQKITLIIFYCKPKSNRVKLSKEHEEARWIDLKKEKALLAKFFWKEAEAYKKRFAKK